MVRAPCCEKMGLKKGPWTSEEDEILVSHINTFGHGNWRALPKLAGLLRCGKSCRLRWINYLRPDIKRGNFTKEEEESIINLHESLGNRWSAIAAKLPGRTDNEIKNVWHTYLKKRVHMKSNGINVQDQSTKPKKNRKKTTTSLKTTTDEVEMITATATADNVLMASSSLSSSPSRSYSSTDNSWNSSISESSHLIEEWTDTSIEFPEIEDSFWSEVMPVDEQPSAALTCANTNIDESMDFWFRVFMEAGELGEKENYLNFDY
ncbi:hypothetical protein J5N97_023350 [Dioscorea zingiberensis]|uniref:Uncharacterized protein n=1 Tax=Dioscorea zingiberensis TaxID=325984 RepID=A0A9D5HBV0_9LILI|nr:hypothetical protein J5N97_023350 [Dioscorea zingiberensis]